LNAIARPAQDAAVGDDVALYIEEPSPGPRRLDDAAHRHAGEIGKQYFPLVGVPDSTLAERRGKDLALRLQRLDLLANEARLVFAKIKKPAREKRQRQYVDGEDPAGER